MHPGCEELEKTDDQALPRCCEDEGRSCVRAIPGQGYPERSRSSKRVQDLGEGEGGGLASRKAAPRLISSNARRYAPGYHVDAQIGGKLAQLGQRLINGAAKKMADEFFANFAREL